MNNKIIGMITTTVFVLMICTSVVVYGEIDAPSNIYNDDIESNNDLSGTWGYENGGTEGVVRGMWRGDFTTKAFIQGRMYDNGNIYSFEYKLQYGNVWGYINWGYGFESVSGTYTHTTNTVYLDCTSSSADFWMSLIYE